MSAKITRFFLPVFYIFCFVCLIGLGIIVYNMDVEQKNRLLAIGSELNIKDTGEVIELDLNDPTKKQEVFYQIEDESIVKINEDGNLVSVGEGSTKVTVTDKDNGKTQTFVVNVGEEAIKEYEENKNNSNPAKNDDDSNNTDNNAGSENIDNNQTGSIENDVQEDILVNKISLSQTDVSLYVGDSLTLVATINPTNAINKNITWITSNAKVVTVNNGVIKAIGEGSATITVKTTDNKSATCKVIVKKANQDVNGNIVVTKIYLNKTSLDMIVGDSDRIIATISPNNATNKSVTYQSSNTKIVTVDQQGNIKAVGVGSTMISAKTSNGVSASCKVTVSAKTVKVTKVLLNKSSVALSVGGSITLTATISPNNATNKNVTWLSSDNTIASVDSSGKVVAKKNGVATITVKTKDGNYTAKCTVTVKEKVISVTGINLNASSSTVYLNAKSKNVSLIATITPSNATNKRVTWTSSDTNVATVNSNGLVTAKNPGVATISVRTSDGDKVASMKITVKKKIVIIIGASQVSRMAQYKNSYSSSKYNYNTSDGTLVYVQDGGTGIDWQVGTGFTKAKSIIDKYSAVKNQTIFYIHFPLVGNTIRNFTCDQISSSNSTIRKYVVDYNNAIQTIKNNGYNVNGYVSSMHPVKPSQAKTEFVVPNEDPNSCSSGYRSNWKYYQFNKAIKSIIESNYSANLKYQSLLVKIMDVNSNGKNFSFKINYNTTDGFHWDEATTKTYVDIMLGYTNDLN